jgi:hypothetical protein
VVAGPRHFSWCIPTRPRWRGLQSGRPEWKL